MSLSLKAKRRTLITIFLHEHLKKFSSRWQCCSKKLCYRLRCSKHNCYLSLGHTNLALISLTEKSQFDWLKNYFSVGCMKVFYKYCQWSSLEILSLFIWKKILSKTIKCRFCWWLFDFHSCCKYIWQRDIYKDIYCCEVLFN